jgi:hypothetical protein
VLTAVTGLLRSRNLLQADDEPGYNVTVISEHISHVAVYASDGASFHVKVKECGRWPNEYANYCEAERLFPRQVPKLLARELTGNREVIAFQGVPHSRIAVGGIARGGSRLSGEILRFFQTSGAAARIALPAIAHRVFLREVAGRAPDTTCAAIVGAWMATPSVDSLPHIRQHGDLVLSNVGLTRAGLVVFDWEDFGQVAFPGLDLCTLLASDTQFNAATLRAIMDGGGALPDGYALLLDKGCQAIGLAPQLFRQLLPLYLVLFLDLKRDYGSAIAGTVRNLVHELAQ